MWLVHDNEQEIMVLDDDAEINEEIEALKGLRTSWNNFDQILKEEVAEHIDYI